MSVWRLRARSRHRTSADLQRKHSGASSSRLSLIRVSAIAAMQRIGQAHSGKIRLVPTRTHQTSTPPVLSVLCIKPQSGTLIGNRRFQPRESIATPLAPPDTHTGQNRWRACSPLQRGTSLHRPGQGLPDCAGITCLWPKGRLPTP